MYYGDKYNILLAHMVEESKILSRVEFRFRSDQLTVELEDYILLLFFQSKSIGTEDKQDS